jgi:hypothetical protein
MRISNNFLSKKHQKLAQKTTEYWEISKTEKKLPSQGGSFFRIIL